MKIAIHHRKGSFSDRWIQYCEIHNIVYKLVDCYSNKIIEDLKGCDGLIWHWNQNDYKAALSARQITKSIESMGLKIFPDTNTSWHFDDKVGQKYLLEAINAPMVESHVFYTKKEAMEWLSSTSFPKVFKLRGGAGSVNVKLVKTYSSGRKLIRKAFSSGFSPINKTSMLNDRVWVFKRDKSFHALVGILKGFIRCFIPKDHIKFAANEKGYVYFQDFIPKNSFDTRLVVVGNRCIAMRRYCRENDFRASGSGIIAYERELFDMRMIKIAFEVAKKIGSQSLAFDFITNEKSPLIIELSYCYAMGDAYDNCHGYWDENLEWHKEKINPQYFIIDDFIKTILSL
jgi:glutathione synthase/RimK-type ligase-like ATP-grasp enzyme